MTASKFRILLLGDELGLSEQIMKAFQQDGHEVVHCVRPDEAQFELGRGTFQFLLVDCMLPGSVNGVDFVLNCKKSMNIGSMKFVLMSGIFTDKEFVKDAMSKTKAVAFVEKKAPFDVAPLVQVVKANAGPAEMPPIRKQLYQIFAKEKVSNREKRKLIESLEEVNGFDLPFIYSLLVETRSSGYLNIYEKNGSVSGISISDGCIIGVDAEDRTTFLGEMLIQSGYAMPNHVQKALDERTNQKIGSRLINSNQLSPHAFDVILTEQMNIRLSRTVTDHVVKVNFAIADLEKTNPHIDSELLQYYLHDWIAAKIDTAWLKALYLMWSGNPILLSPTFKGDHPALEMGLVRALPDLLTRVREGGVTLSQLLESKKYPESAVYKALHFLLTKGLIVFGAKVAFASVAEQQVALKKIWADIQEKNPYEIIDMIGNENLQPEALAKFLGNAPSDPNSALGVLWNNLQKKIADATKVAQDPQGRVQFQEDAASKQAENKMKAGQRIEEAKQKLALNQYGPAMAILLDVQKQFPQIENIHLMLAWAKLGQIVPAKKPIMMKEIEFELVQVPAEERYDAHYPMVLGIFQKTKGDLAAAKKSLERAIAMNPSLLAARRELSQVESLLKKNNDLFNVDLKQMVSGFFKKK
ncbi:MAG: response regulator transcription factor [Bdellovibrionaceae bacterium]|nr:response regulator transcription factor [Pseudobdellovibrionaceae bacterium]